MLKALELAGFKSFADRTKFDFPRGISVVVGPNGSGKSNVVDAVKWVLGSQSAKSLRGKEMIDVIFNGAASRGPLGTAEATLTLDNSERRLSIDAPEVHITRRVFRSGEAEYLINRQPCRLRDIKELLAGTGITTEAYCIIEQGRVDALLQSSPRERRIIFEEAAGISQFKLKKAAAMRRLERVEQNLLRLSDIVDEVESRLRSVRSQAGKARRYREHAQRLRYLRTQLGLADWRTYSRQLADRDAQLAELRRRQHEHEELVERSEASLAELECRLENGDRHLRELDAAASATRERIVARQAVLENLTSRRVDLEQDVDRFRRQLSAMTSRTSGNQLALRDVDTQVRAAEAEFELAAEQFRAQHQQVQAAQQQLEHQRHRCDALEQNQTEALQTLASLGTQATALEARLATTRSEQERSSNHIAELKEEHAIRANEVATTSDAETQLHAQIEACELAMRDAEKRRAQVHREFARADKQHRELDGRLGRTRERIAVLTELEERLEGMDTSVQDILRAAREAPDGPLGEICGVVADLMHVDIDTAPLVEVALGERTQFLVLASAGKLLAWLDQQPIGVAGRIGFLRLDLRLTTTALDHVDLSTESGVIGRADRFVEAAPDLLPLIAKLLGRTWFVDRLSTAVRLSQGAGRGLDFVTSDGELLAADGTLVIGPRQAATGMLSRRSELRACSEQALDIERQLEAQQFVCTRLDSQRKQLEELAVASTTVHVKLTAALDQRHEQSVAAETRLAILQSQLTPIVEKKESAEAEIAALERELDVTRHEQGTAEQIAENCRKELQARRQQLAILSQRQDALQAATSEKQIITAKCEQRVEMLREQMQQAIRNQQERDESLAEVRRQIADRQTHVAEIEGAMLVDRQLLAELFLHKDRHIADRDQTLSADESLRRDRSELNERVRTERKQLGVVLQQIHKFEVAASKVRHELGTLRERMQDDYGIDLANEAQHASGEAAESSEPAGNPQSLGPRDAVEHEIAELRHLLNNIGAVNLDALDELDELESRFGNLSQQYRDLVDAKASLEKIVQRINGDSRQIFLATLEVVRGHFQELFRRLFGGGEADIIIDDAEDVLECGIEIVARPPGKEKCSISLLSGGEKTLTCVALLLAVFRGKPSPFCVLDEVDAALDEANIGRFIQVLREFLAFTQFIVVSHSKRTMSGADTLYGVTMEESGVSKRVSVRFDDVSEDGHIFPSVRRNEPSAANDSIAAPTRKAA